MVGIGVTAPLAARMLAVGRGRPGPARRRPSPPTSRGGGGELKVLWWQGPTILNPHLAIGVKDGDGSRIFYEPLVSFDTDGNLVPILAAEVPSLQNGRVARDGLSVTWRLKKGVVWHDGKPLTSDDLVFTWEYAADPATAAVSTGNYKDIARIDKLDATTVRIVYKAPNPGWPQTFGGTLGILPRHVFEPFKGAEVAGGAGQPQAGGHRTLSHRRFRPG